MSPSNSLSVWYANFLNEFQLFGFWFSDRTDFSEMLINFFTQVILTLFALTKHFLYIMRKAQLLILRRLDVH
jgi:hypothetical protein